MNQPARSIDAIVSGGCARSIWTRRPTLDEKVATHHAARSASPLTLVQPPPGTPLVLRAPPLASAVALAEG